MQVRRQHKFLVLGVAIALCLLGAGIIAKRARAGSPNRFADTGADVEHIPYAAVAPVKNARRSPPRSPSPASSAPTRTWTCTPR